MGDARRAAPDHHLALLPRQGGVRFHRRNLFARARAGCVFSRKQPEAPAARLARSGLRAPERRLLFTRGLPARGRVFAPRHTERNAAGPVRSPPASQSGIHVFRRSGATRRAPGCFIVSRRKTGRSEGWREVTRLPSATTSASL